MEENIKEVRFDLYCPTCEHYDEPNDEDPCHYCLECPGRQYTRKPLNYIEKERK